MTENKITTEQIADFAKHLRQAERSPGTIENYLRHVRAFAAWLGGGPVTKEAAADWKAHLISEGYCPSTINAMLGGLNRFLTFAGWQECQVKALRLQRQLFRDDNRELTRAEYDRLIAAAHAMGRERLALLMETICATGIRVSEVRSNFKNWREPEKRRKIRLQVHGRLRKDSIRVCLETGPHRQDPHGQAG